MSKPAHRSAKTPPRQVRIIGGVWKRTPLAVLDAEGLRPTPDRVRETLFNWLYHLRDGDLSGARCLDLFAGSGALGFEAASRGASEVTMIESHTPAVRQLEATAAKLHAQQVRVLRGDAYSIVSRMAQSQAASLDLIFLDPPYGQGWLEKILPFCAQLLAKDGLLYAEAETSLDGEEAPNWVQDWDVLRAERAGMVHYHLLRRKIPASN